MLPPLDYSISEGRRCANFTLLSPLAQCLMHQKKFQAYLLNMHAFEKEGRNKRELKKKKVIKERSGVIVYSSVPRAFLHGMLCD